jgi:hypothetical protein
MTSEARRASISFGYESAGGNGSPAAHTPPPLRAVSRDFVDGSLSESHVEPAYSVDLPDGYRELNSLIRSAAGQPENRETRWIEPPRGDSTDRFAVPDGRRIGRRLETRVADSRLGIRFKLNRDELKRSDFMSFVEPRNARKHGNVWPAHEQQAPCFVVRLGRPVAGAESRTASDFRPELQRREQIRKATFIGRKSI